MPVDPEDLGAILALDAIDGSSFRGHAPETGGPRIFGGLVVAQALLAASRTVDGRSPHSLHGYFLLPGDPAVPITYEVERLRDGGSFSARSCRALQNGRPILTLTASFHRTEPGLHHAIAMPAVPPPESLADGAELARREVDGLPEAVRRYLTRRWPVEMRPVDPAKMVRRRAVSGDVMQAVWMRVSRPLPDDPAVQAAALAYLSDMTLLDTALVGHGRSVFDADLQAASLDHAMWFHRPCRADRWLLYAADSPSAEAARGFTRGHLFMRDGRLVASTAQEGLIRPLGRS